MAGTGKKKDKVGAGERKAGIGRSKNLSHALKKVGSGEENGDDDGDGRKEETARLRKELASLSKDMVYEDLRFLVAQSMLLLRNREAESLEREIAESYQGVSGGNGDSAQSPAARKAMPVQILRSASGNANLVMDGNFKLLTAEELAAMAKIAISEGGQADRLERLYRWIDRERRDILIDYDLSLRSAKFRELLGYLEKTFAKRKEKARAVKG